MISAMASSSLTIPMMRLLDENEDDRPIRPHKNPYDLNSKIMLTAIISLSVIVVLVVILHTYARCVLRRQALRRAATLRRLSSTVAHAYSPTEPPKTGLEPSVIAALPVFVFKCLEGQESPESAAEVECAVCLSMLEDEEMARLLPNCKHSFHAECIDTWLKSHTTCPICRTEAEPRPVLQPVPREGPAAGEVLPTAPPLESLSSATGGEAPTAPLLEGGSSLLSCAEGTSHDGKSVSNGSISKLSTSFRRILSRDRSSRRTQSCGQEDGIDEDLERG